MKKQKVAIIMTTIMTIVISFSLAFASPFTIPDTKPQEPSKLSIQQIDPAKLDKADAVRTVNGNGKSVIYVFSQPGCYFCEKLEAELQELDNMTVYIFPLPGKAEGAQLQAIAAWCAKDKTRAWREIMLGKTVKKSECDSSALSRNVMRMHSLKFWGTPILINDAGKVHVGLLDAEKIEAFISGNVK